MASDSSFDVVSKVEMPEVLNAVDQANKEIGQRYDFRGSKNSKIELDQKEGKLTLTSDDELKLKQVVDVLQNKLIKRSVPIKNLEYGKVESAGGGTARQVVTLQQGIPQDKAKEMVKIIKSMKLKVQAQIKEDEIRVTGKKKDELQSVMTELKSKDFGVDLQFTNYR